MLAILLQLLQALHEPLFDTVQGLHLLVYYFTSALLEYRHELILFNIGVLKLGVSRIIGARLSRRKARRSEKTILE